MKILKKILIFILSLLLVVGSYLLYDYLKHKDDCCTCCPNLKEGEVCIEMCCRYWVSPKLIVQQLVAQLT